MDWAISDEKETLIYCEINYGTRNFDGVIGDVFLNVLVCSFPDNTHRKSFILNSDVLFFTRKNHTSLFRYANASIRNTSLPSLDAIAAYILPFLLFKMSEVYEATLSRDHSLYFNMVWEDQA
jgi:hypothetical protein